MMTSQEVLSAYEAMLGLTAELIAAANKHDWERFVHLEKCCSDHAQMISNNSPSLPMTGPSRQKKIALINQLLSDDRTIRDLTAPWMIHLSALIHSREPQRRLAGT
jgi:flagellar protein FliT